MNQLSDNVLLKLTGNDSCVHFIKLILQELRLIRIEMKEEVRKLAVDMKSSLMISDDSKEASNINESEEVLDARANSKKKGFVRAGNNDEFVSNMAENEDEIPMIPHSAGKVCVDEVHLKEPACSLLGPADVLRTDKEKLSNVTVPHVYATNGGAVALNSMSCAEDFDVASADLDASLPNVSVNNVTEFDNVAIGVYEVKEEYTDAKVVVHDSKNERNKPFSSTKHLYRDSMSANISRLCSKAYITKQSSETAESQITSNCDVLLDQKRFNKESTQKRLHEDKPLRHSFSKLSRVKNKKWCPICNGRFTDLKRHSIIHTGERPYQCDLCSKRFNRKFSLKCHMKTHK